MIDPVQDIENAVDNFTRRGIGAIAPKVLQIMATASEPFFRVNMGQRYMDSGAVGGGIFLWFFTSVACGGMGAIYANRLVSASIGIIVTVFFVVLAMQDRKNAMQRHLDGRPRHSMSRGEPRNKEKQQQVFIEVAAAIGLLMFSTPVGAVFVLSRCMSSISEAKQQEAIYSRYLDAIDSKIEAEQLETALLGDSPSENTYLYKPLSKTLPADMRKNIAAAAARGSVRVVAKQPKENRPLEVIQTAGTPASSTPTAEQVQAATDCIRAIARPEKTPTNPVGQSK
jgi:hypothetical protein